MIEFTVAISLALGAGIWIYNLLVKNLHSQRTSGVGRVQPPLEPANFLEKDYHGGRQYGDHPEDGVVPIFKM